MMKTPVPQKTLSSPRLSLATAGLLSLLACSGPALSADRAWNNTGTDFNAAGSWTGGVPTSADRGLFNAAAVTQPNLSASLTLQGLSFTASGYTLTSSGIGTQLTLTNTGVSTSNSALNTSAGTTNIINAPIVLGAAAGVTQTFTNAGNLTFNGVISSANAIAGLNLAGAGTYTFNVANTYSGTTTQSSFSRMIVNHAGAFSTGTLRLASANAGIEAGINLTGANQIANNLEIAGTNWFLYDSGANAIQFGGDVSLDGGARLLRAQISAGAAFDGVISNDGGAGFSIQTENNSVVTLNGVNTYTGNTTHFGSNGAVSVSNIGNAGAAGNLGRGTAINLGSASTAGRLIYTGAGENTSKVLNLNGTTGSVTIEQAGTGLLNFTANTTATGLGNKTLNLLGSTSGTGQISGAVVDSVGFATAVTKDGTGTWILSGANTYTGITTLNAGVLQATDGAGLSSNSVLRLRGGVLQSNGTFNRTLGNAAGNVNWSTGSGGGFAARGGDLILNLNGGTGSVAWGTGATNIGGTELIFGSSSADGMVDLQNAVNLGGVARSVRVNDNASSENDFARMSGALSGAGGGIIKEGAGVLELTGDNSYGGTTTVNVGTLIAAHNKAVGNTSLLTVSGGTFDVRGTTAGTVTLGVAAAFSLTSGDIKLQLGTTFDQIVSSGAGAFTITGGTFELDVTGIGFDYNDTYQVLSGFGGVNTVSNLAFTGYDTTNYVASLDSTGLLSFNVIPEPTATVLLIGGMTVLVLVRRKRQY
jgi:fibronectin-binding autotransporter adhesin